MPDRHRTPTDLLEIIRKHHHQPSVDSEALLNRLSVHPLDGGLNNVLYVWKGDLRQWCIKLFKVDERHRAEREWKSICLLTARGLSVAPRPFLFQPSAFMPAIIMEFIPGVPLSKKEIGIRELLALARTLHQIHAIVPEDVEYPYTVVGSPYDRIIRMQRWLEQLESQPTDPDTAKVIPLLHRWFQSEDPSIIQTPSRIIFSRGDPNLANCLWDGASIRCVDFEYAGWSDLAYELADLVEGTHARRVEDRNWAEFLSQFNLLDTNRSYAVEQGLVIMAP